MAFSETGGRPHFALSPLAWCGRRDLNPHDFRHGNLNPARLPIPPRPRGAVTGQSCAAIPAGLNATMAAKARLNRGPPVDLVYLAAGATRMEGRKETYKETYEEPDREITIRTQRAVRNSVHSQTRSAEQPSIDAGQHLGKVLGDQAGSKLACGFTVQPNRGAGRFKGCHFLRQQAGHKACQDVPRASRGKRRRGVLGDCCAPVRACNNGISPLQNQNSSNGTGGYAGSLKF